MIEEKDNLLEREPRKLLRNKRRLKTRKVIYIITTIITLVLGGVFLWYIRPIIFPAIIGLIVAYMCTPLLRYFMGHGIPRDTGILLLFGAFLCTIFVFSSVISNLIPDERDRLILQTRLQYKLNERYRDTMNITKPEDKGNFLYRYFGDDFDRFMNGINGIIRFSPEEEKLFLKYRIGYNDKPPIEDRFYNFYLKNSLQDKKEILVHQKELTIKSKQEVTQRESNFTLAMDIFKTWIVMPFVFLFLLIDNGEIKRFFVNLLPNRYFEVSLSVIDKVNSAIENYLKGIFLECSLVGISYFLLLILIGFEFKLAVLIGLITGFVNVIPLMGPIVFSLIGISFALISENFASNLPFITGNNLFFAIIFCVVLVMILDNLIFQPVLLGAAVKLHPLVIILGIMCGSLIGGLPGVLLALPVIVVFKEFFQTLFRELKDYYII